MNSMTVQSAIQLHLSREGPCTLESLLTRLSQFSWSEIFSVVDQLSREGSLVLRRPARFGYEVSINSPQVMSEICAVRRHIGLQSLEAYGRLHGRLIRSYNELMNRDGAGGNPTIEGTRYEIGRYVLPL